MFKNIGAASACTLGIVLGASLAANPEQLPIEAIESWCWEQVPNPAYSIEILSDCARYARCLATGTYCKRFRGARDAAGPDDESFRQYLIDCPIRINGFRLPNGECTGGTVPDPPQDAVGRGSDKRCRGYCFGGGEGLPD